MGEKESGLSTFFIGSTLCVCFIVYQTIKLFHKSIQHYKTFEELGIPGPKPILFIGNALDFAKKPKKLHEVNAGYVKKYGRVVGLYMGNNCRYLVTDPAIIKEITVKQFGKFCNRSIPFHTGTRFDIGLLMLRDERWKRVRSILTPTFTANKIKNMRSLVDQATDILMQKMGRVAKTGESIDIWRWFGEYTMQIIMAAAFATHVDSQTNKNDVLTNRAYECLHLNPLAIVSAIFAPSIFPIVSKIDGKFFNAMKFMDNFADKVLSERMKDKDAKFRDLMQLMIDASDESTKSTLSHDETVGQIITMLLAGYETTSNALGYIVYLLALHEEVQNKLLDEIDLQCDFESDSEIAYDTIMHNMRYLDMVVSESLRLYPTVIAAGREVREDCVINDIKFVKGFTVNIPIYALHRDPEFWNEPDKFDPERFSDERKVDIDQYIYLPFGIGPRSCIGKRFALMEIKLSLIRVLRSYRFVTCPETQIPLQVKAAGSLAPENGIYLRVVKRQ